jgi:hypothetical protein
LAAKSLLFEGEPNIHVLEVESTVANRPFEGMRALRRPETCGMLHSMILAEANIAHAYGARPGSDP